MTVVRALQYIVVGNAVLLLLQSIRVISIYSAVYSVSPKDWRRQLPLHVWLMATSFSIYVAGTAFFLLKNDGPDGGFRSVLYLVAGLIAQYALWNVLQYDRRRYSKVTNFQDPDTDAPGSG